MSFTVGAGELSIALEPRTARLRLGRRGSTIAEAREAPRFRLAGQSAVVKSIEAENGGVRVVLEGEDVRGTWTLLPGDNAIRSTIDIDGPTRDDAVEIEIPFPPSAAIDIPAHQVWGERIGSSSPVGRANGIALSSTKNQLAAVETEDAALAFIGLADYTRRLPGTYGSVWREGAYRDRECLWLHLQTINGSPFQISAHADLKGVIDKYCAVVGEGLGLVTIDEDPSIPDWYHDLRVFVGFEMYRSDGEILNTFAHVAAFCRDLEDLGVKGGVVVRLVGFQGRFDSRYPYFHPSERLGGAAGLKAAAAAVHAGGNRLMMHFNIWGLDPYLENFEELEHLAMPYDRVYERIPTGQIDRYDGWPGPYPAKPTGFDSGPLPVEPLEVTDSYVVFETGEIPEPMEAFLTVSGVQTDASGRLCAEVDERRVESLPGNFAHTDTVRFRFRFRFKPGKNLVRLDFLDGALDLSKAMYRIDRSIAAGNVWSYPIIRADIHHPEWIDITRKNMVEVGREYDVDIPYIDAINIWRTEDRPIFDMIKEELPGRVFACEYSAELGYNMFRLTGAGVRIEPPDRASDFSKRIHERFTRFFTAGYASVPYGGPSWHLGRLDASKEENRPTAERLLSECPRWGILPGVRLNYRDFGLDERARDIILDACQGSRA